MSSAHIQKKPKILVSFLAFSSVSSTLSSVNYSKKPIESAVIK